MTYLKLLKTFKSAIRKQNKNAIREMRDLQAVLDNFNKGMQSEIYRGQYEQWRKVFIEKAIEEARKHKLSERGKV